MIFAKIFQIISVWQIGRTKVFLRAGQMAELDARRTEVRSKAARAVQSRFRTHVARQRFLIVRNKSVDMQSIVRGKIALYDVSIGRQCLQQYSTGEYVEHYLQRVPFSFAALLAFKQRVFLRKQASALTIQKSVRCYFALKSYSELRRSAITLQIGLRAFGAYKEYVLKKQEKASINIQVDY
jgi:myosin-5